MRGRGDRAGVGNPPPTPSLEGGGLSGLVSRESDLFGALQPTLSGGHAPAYAELAARLGRNEGAIKTAVHRLRRRFRDVLRNEVASTVVAPEEIDDELAYLRDVLASESGSR